MKASEQVKAAGLKNLKELSELSQQSTRTLINWHANKPELFKVVLAGAVQVKKEETQ